MDLSTDNLLDQQQQINSYVLQNLSDILDLENVNLDNEETWLCDTERKTNIECRGWLYKEMNCISKKNLVAHLKSAKNIDTRTFTRPKRRLIRPSIEQYEQLYNSSSDTTEMSSSTEILFSSGLKLSEKVEEEPEPTQDYFTKKPLHFDLSQPINNFDSFMLNSSEFDSFQNMSPPSLVNSLCSSTFANLMENSFIKNDPVLREIRDKDFTETALLQDTEAPIFQSITESCSSINSDSPENFLKKVSTNHSFRKNMLENSTVSDTVQENGSDNSNNSTFKIGSNMLESTFSKGQLNSVKTIDESKSGAGAAQFTSPKVEISTNHNGTYRRTPKLNGTFRKSDLKKNRLSLNLTYEMHKDNFLDSNTSKSVEKDLSQLSSEDLSHSRSSATMILPSNSIEDMKKRYSLSDVHKPDLNKLNYCVEEKVNQINSAYKDGELNRTVNIKRSSLGSADSLDRMSSLSSSSKGSNKMLNMADIDAIVEMQERTLNQAMSTPKPNIGAKKIWENTLLSPIVRGTREHLSDSELSSEEYKSVRSTLSSKTSIENYPKHPTKSMGYLAEGTEIKQKTTGHTLYTLASQKPLQALSNNIRGSYGNLKTIHTNIGGSHTTLYRPSNLVRAPSQTNLRIMGNQLKGSYTSLKPISANLPVVPPAETNLKNHAQLRKTTEVSLSKEKAGAFLKPQIPRSSGLPRPTGIPRPASRIPGPRSSNVRPSYSRSSNY
ncbi:uncharacterized protein LOC132705690 [Cylas formicarius]|uniref:uncharacterized protein LOC132705690 n=1 Tax=Cylas formicarius TaxID=197179 RepID=UPI002958BA61|nr:uncharacterized protein LOC132705690 [Cylas formicarius]